MLNSTTIQLIKTIYKISDESAVEVYTLMTTALESIANDPPLDIVDEVHTLFIRPIAYLQTTVQYPSVTDITDVITAYINELTDISMKNKIINILQSLR